MIQTSVRPRIVMTLLVRDEEEILADNIWYHFHQGVEAFIVMDNLSKDTTPQIIAELSKFIPINYIRQVNDDYNQCHWVTEMARQAVSHFNAEWVINSDADEFWFSPHGKLIDSISNIPDEVGLVKVERMNAVPIYKDRDPKKARSGPRESTIFETKSLNSLGNPLPPKCFHRASDTAMVSQGNHFVSGVPGKTVTSDNIIIYHFPYQSHSHYYNKIFLGGQAYQRNKELSPAVGRTWQKAYEDLRTGQFDTAWGEFSFDESRSEFELLRGRFLRDRSLLKEMILSDHSRSEKMLSKAHKEISEKTSKFAQKKSDQLLDLLKAFPDVAMIDRPLYRNLPFILSSVRKHKEEIFNLSGLGGSTVSFDRFRDIVSLAPANTSITEFATARLQAEEPVSSRTLQRDIQNKNIVLHISCHKFIEKALLARETFKSVCDNVTNIIVVGRPEQPADSPTSWNFDYRDGVLTVPTPDTYEMLHRKVLHALMLIASFGPPKSVTKIDDSINLLDGDVFLNEVNNTCVASAGGAGRIVGSLRHDTQVHGWHIGKCRDLSLEARGYSYPLPRRYPAGGYGYILNPVGINACRQMYLSMKEYLNMPAIGLEDVCIGHAFYAAGLDFRNISDEDHLLALPGLTLIE